MKKILLTATLAATALCATPIDSYAGKDCCPSKASKEDSAKGEKSSEKEGCSDKEGC